ncbi:MAG: amino acid permease [Oxalobacter sp.]|nr:amino acid permease [Oxalobacter sp.]
MPAPENHPSQDSPAQGTPRRTVRLLEAIVLIIGLVIGSGIFKAPTAVAGMTGNSSGMFIAWILGGVVSLIGALCYAELATAFPHAGGDYHFIERAYGRSVAFLFGWARISVITTGSIALLAFVFGDYMQRLFSLDIGNLQCGSFIYAIAIVIILSWLNIRNVHTGMRTQALFTAIQVICLMLIIGGAVYLTLTGNGNPQTMQPQTAAPSMDFSGFGLAMVFVLLTFGGWNEAAYISAELENGRKNMVRALVFSITAITLLYLLVNWAYWTSLGLPGMASSKTIAADTMQLVWGEAAEKIISLMIAVSSLTSINATIIVGARSSYAMGQDWKPLRKLGVWNTERNTPVNALVVQCLASIVLVILGTLIGGGFNSMVEFTAPVFWLFFLLAGISLFILRKQPRADNAFRVPFYPVLPIIFCLTCGYMLWSSLSYVYDQSLGNINAAWIGVAVLLIGLGLLGIIRRLHKENR